jgi:hypothetical protein
MDQYFTSIPSCFFAILGLKFSNEVASYEKFDDPNFKMPLLEPFGQIAVYITHVLCEVSIVPTMTSSVWLQSLVDYQSFLMKVFLLS